MIETLTVAKDSELALEVVRRTITPEQIEELEGFMLELPQSEAPVRHVFSKGTYTRVVTLPMGSFAIGHAHREDCINLVLSGLVSVLIDGKIMEIGAGAVFNGKAMQRKVGYIKEDSIWATVHATEETDLEKLEELLICKSETFKAHERKVAAAHAASASMIREFEPLLESEEAIDADKVDFMLAISELGFTAESVREISENTVDQTCLPEPLDSKIALAASQREGKGIFAKQDIAAGEFIATARFGEKRTIAGRYTNHSSNPNASMKITGNSISLFASKGVSHGNEIVVDYRMARAESIKSMALAGIQ